MNIKSLKFDMAAEYGPINSRKILLRNHVLDSVLHNLKGHITNFLHIPIFCQPLGAFLRKYGISTQTWVENTPKIPSRSMVLFQIATALNLSKMGQQLFKGDGDIINVSFILVHTKFFMDILYV